MAKKFSTMQMVLAALFVALITVGAFLKVQVGVIPFSLQLMFVLLAGQLLPPLAAAGSLFTYLLLGLLGVPVFAGGGGLGYVLQPSFGYIPGFLAAAVAVSLITRCGKPGLLKNLIANACGVGLVYLFGLSYYFCLNTFYFGRVVALSKMLLYCWVIFIPSDVIALVLTAFLGQKLRRFVPQKG